MSTYDLDDEAVRRWLTGSDAAARDEIDKALANQLPLPVPTNIGAIVTTLRPNGTRERYVRWAWDSHSHEPWIEFNSDQTYRSDQIGRIVDVPFEGLDL